LVITSTVIPEQLARRVVLMPVIMVVLQQAACKIVN
jgi:hypothetical protein